MRSKSKARKLLQEDTDDYEVNDIEANYDDVTSAGVDASPNGENNDADVADSIAIPREFVFRGSDSHPSTELGLWAKYDIPNGRLFGTSLDNLDVQESVESQRILTEAEISTWLNSLGTEDGQWMKYVRTSDTREFSNLMAVHVHGKVFYKALRDICTGEEMLLLNSESAYEKDEDALKLSQEETVSKLYPCKFCSKTFETRLELQHHQAYECSHSNRFDIMPPRISDDVTTDDHAETKSLPESDNSMEEIQHGMVNGEFKCEECPRSFQWKSNLIRHQISHDSGKKFSCENCDKVFTDPSNLQRHIRSQHVGARSHACSECGKTFATSSGLKQHQHIHSSVKPFQCEVCLKAYTQFSNLCRHKRMHADCRQQIKCKDCGQAFSTVTSLSKHKRFCEGALRNGMHLGFPPSEKLNPLSITSVSGVPAPSPINPALYMGMYRPPYPFYPPIGATFPVFPGNHSFPSLSSPILPTKLTDITSPKIKPVVSPSVSPKPRQDAEHSENKLKRRNSFGSESNDSPLSTGSDVENNSSGSDAESESSAIKRPRKSPTPEKRPEKSASPVKVTDITPSAFHSRLSSIPFVPTRPSLKPTLPSPQLSPIVPKMESSLPFDLTKSQKSATPSPSHVSPSKPESSASGEQPLDLTRKAPKEITPPENPRRTHIFGINGSSMDSRLHYAYPQFTNAMILEQMKMEREKLQHTFQEAAKYLPFSRFPLGSPSFPSASLGVMKQEEKLSPLMKMEKMPEAFPYSGAHKIKERYSCKYCGKVFPRSANLTRHLRTHTGEQPYKCKYCERSFSISSNLQRHVRNIHNKEKPFRCTLCDRCFGQQTNLDRHLKKHETEGPNVRDSPVNEPDLDSKDDSYFSEIRNFIGKATTSGLPLLPIARGIPSGLQQLLNQRVERDDTYDAVDDELDDEDDFDDDLDEEVCSREVTPTKCVENGNESALSEEKRSGVVNQAVDRKEIIPETAHLPCA